MLDSWEATDSKNYSVADWPKEYDFKKKKPFKNPDSKSQWIAFIDACKEKKRKKPKGARPAPTLLASCPKQEADDTLSAFAQLINKPGPASLERLLWASEAPLRAAESGSTTVAKSILANMRTQKVLLGRKGSPWGALLK